MGKDAGEIFDLGADGGRTFVGYAEDESVAGGIYFFRLAVGVDAGAGRVRDGVLIDEVAVSVMKGVEGHVVKQAMLHEDDVTGLEQMTDGRDEFLIEAL